jgi:hypothetical protein
VHTLMGKGDAEVNLVAGDGNETGDEGEAEDEYECEDGYGYDYECGGWWVGTVGATDMPEGINEPSGITADQGPAQGDNQDKMEDEGQAEWERSFQVDECSEGEMAGDEQWDLEVDHPSLEEEGAGAPLRGPSQHLPDCLTRPPHLAGARRPRSRMRPRVTSDQQWEEARHSAWLRQLLSDDSSDEDEDEERYGRFAESGRWMTELYGSPQHPTTTSGRECSV